MNDPEACRLERVRVWLARLDARWQQADARWYQWLDRMLSPVCDVVVVGIPLWFILGVLTLAVFG